MTLEDFNNLLNDNPYFIELDRGASSSFAAINHSGSEIRARATETGVIVFLKNINKIFAHGTYYGISYDDWETVSNNLTTINNLLNGDSSIQDDKGLIERISDLEEEIAEVLGGNSGGLTDAITNLVNNRFIEIFGDDYTNDLSELMFVKSSFETLVSKIGASDVEDEVINWNTGQDGTNTIIKYITDLQLKVNNLAEIPQFKIEIVGNNNGLPNVNNPQQGTIYLIVTSSGEGSTQNDVFTEFIYLDTIIPNSPNNQVYGWEKIGQQSINMGAIDPVALENLSKDMVEYLESIQGADIAAVINYVDALKNQIFEEIDNPETGTKSYQFKLTGENIKTSSGGENTIAADIAALYSSKMNVGDVQWVLIN